MIDETDELDINIRETIEASKDRGLYDDLTIKDKSRSRAQSRKLQVGW